jgi:hypothetical protein
MPDRELLELAAKAAGYVRMQYLDNVPYVSAHLSADDFIAWNPLIDDGDALRLAGQLRIGIDFDHGNASDNCVYAHPVVGSYTLTMGELLDGDHNADRFAATRRAIVRAAAEIGRATIEERGNAD